MKKRHNSCEQTTQVIKNPVAKFAHAFNKACAFADKKKYQRHAKHKKQAVSLIILFAK